METNEMDYQKVNPVIRWIMFSSLSVIFITLLINWLLSFFLYHDLTVLILENFSKFNITSFSVFMLSISVISLVLGLLLVFLKKKNTYTNLLSLISFLWALAIVVSILILYSQINFNINDKKYLFINIPLIITVVASGFLFVNSGFNLIVSNKKDKHDNFLKMKPWTQQVIKDEKDDVTSIDLLMNEKINLSKKNDTILFNNDISDDSDINELEDETTIIFDEKMPLFNLKGLKREENDDEEIHSLTEVLARHAKELPEPLKWSKEEIKKVWEQGIVIPGVDKNLYRKDYAGAWMYFSAFVAIPDQTVLDFQSYGWTIVNHKPLSRDGTNNLSNLKPMNVINAITKGENYPKWKTKVSSMGNENIVKEQIWSD